MKIDSVSWFAIVPQTINDIGQCRNTTFIEQTSLVKTFSAFCALGALLGCVLVPILLQNLRGSPKVFLVLQQISAFLCVIFSFVSLEISNSSLIELPSRDWSDTSAINSWLKTQKISNFWAAFFSSQHLSFSILQSLNYHEMITNPSHYEDYASIKRVVCRILALSLLSIISCVDFLIECAPSSRHVLYTLRIVRLVKYPIIKVSYTVTLIFVAYKIRKCLNQSNSVRGSTTLSSLFMAACVIPLINNMLFLGTELPNIVIPYLFSRKQNLHATFCKSAVGHFARHIQMPLTISIYTMGSLIQCAAFLVCFPKLRENVFTKLWSFGKKCMKPPVEQGR